MRQKPARKNAHKERIFALHQNKTNFTYQKIRCDETENRIHELFAREQSDYKTELSKKGSHVA